MEESSAGRGGAGAESPPEGLGGVVGEQEEAEGGGSARPQRWGLGRAPWGWGQPAGISLEDDGKQRGLGALYLFI